MRATLLCLLCIFALSLSQEYVECEETAQCENAKITGNNVKGLKCTAANACKNAQITLECDPDTVCVIECTDSEGSCDGLQLTIDAVEKIICHSCVGATITVARALDDFKLECKEDHACEDLVLTTTVPADSFGDDDFEGFEGFSCDKDGACLNAHFVIFNEGSETLFIEELNCEGNAACQSLTLSVMDGTIDIDECKCGDSGGCTGAVGIDACFGNLDKLECTADLCASKELTITNPQNGFEIVCNDVGSCFGTSVTVIVNDNADDAPITDFKGVKCNAEHSCVGLHLSIMNQQSDGSVIVVEKVECDGTDSCLSAYFEGNFQGNVVFAEINCDDNCGAGATQCHAEYNTGLLACDNIVFQ